MSKRIGFVAMTALIVAGLLRAPDSDGQTPEQQQLWDAQRARTEAAERTRQEHLTKDRAARKADPMAWVRTLNPMSAGGWEFRAVANDGSWAAFSTRHQLTRAGKTVTVWLRQEYAEPQANAADNSQYLSVVVKTQYDCVKERTRPLIVIYYTDNNIQGSEQTEEADTKTATWDAIVPGTRDESNFLWACGTANVAAHK